MSDKVAFANAPIEKTPNGSHWLWSWAFAIPKSSKSPDAAKKFAVWATSKEYIKMVAEESGWATVPPGTRKSLYENPEYQKAAPFAAVTLQAMQTADPTNPAIRPVPYTGVQFVGIPEFQSFGHGGRPERRRSPGGEDDRGSGPEGQPGCREQGGQTSRFAKVARAA